MSENNARVDGALPWPTRSPNLSMCDFFLWGILKIMHLSTTIQELKEQIREEVSRIPVAMLRNVMTDE
jgi:hypothetical protein